MTSPYHDRPRGHADTAARRLTAASEGIYLPSIPSTAGGAPARQIVALEGIGWALLAVCDQLAGLAGAVTGVQDQVADVAAAVGDLPDGALPAEADQVLQAAARGPGKSGMMRRFLADFFRRHPGAQVRVVDRKEADAGTGGWSAEMPW
jgi:hypothetical protein